MKVYRKTEEEKEMRKQSTSLPSQIDTEEKLLLFPLWSTRKIKKWNQKINTHSTIAGRIIISIGQKNSKMHSFGPPECTAIAGSAHTSFSNVITDRQHRMWFVDAAKQSVFTTDRDTSVRSLQSGSIEAEEPFWTVPDASQSIIVGFFLGSIEEQEVIWLVTSDGSITAIDCEGLRALCQHSLDAAVLVCCAAERESGVVLALDRNGCEIVLVSYKGKADETLVTSGQALFHVTGSVEWMCVVPGRSLLVCISSEGEITIWDVADNEDRTEALGSPQFRVEECGRPTAMIPAGRGVWVGTTMGGILEVRLDGQHPVVENAVQHNGAVRCLMLMSLGQRVWSVSDDGTVVVWLAAQHRPCGVFEMQEVPIQLLVSAPPQLRTMVWSLDQTQTLKCWEVKESFTQLDAPTPPVPAQQDSTEVTQFVSELCELLSATSIPSDTRQLLPPPSVQVLHQDAQYLPEALLSLVECRDVLQQVFTELQWDSSSLTDDVRRLAQHTANISHARNRAGSVAEKLNALTPAFPLPDHLVDPVQRLIMASECLLEEVVAQGYLELPPNMATTLTAGRGRGATTPNHRPNGNGISLDDSGTPLPKTQTLSNHIFETQLRTLEAQLQESQREVTMWRDRHEKLERESERLDRLLKKSNTESAKMQQELHHTRRDSSSMKASVSEKETQLSEASRALAASKLEVLKLEKELETTDRTKKAKVSELQDFSMDLLRQSERLHASSTAAAAEFERQLDRAREREVQYRRSLEELQMERDRLITVFHSLTSWLKAVPHTTVEKSAIASRLLPLQGHAQWTSQESPSPQKRRVFL